MPFEQATEPCQALQTGEDAGSAQTVEVGENTLPKPQRVWSTQSWGQSGEISCQTQGRVCVLVTVMLQVTPWPLYSFNCRVGLGRAGWGYPEQSTPAWGRCASLLNLHKDQV